MKRRNVLGLMAGTAVAATLAKGDMALSAPGIPKMGVHEDISATSLKSKYPGVELERRFIPGVLSTPTDLRTKFSSVCSAYWSAGLDPFPSFKTSTSATIRGDWDSRLRELAIYLASKPQTSVIWWHEPENDMSGSTFGQAFKRVRDVMKGANANLKIGYSAMSYQWRSGSSSTSSPSAWRVAADFYGCDAYSGQSFPFTHTLPEHAGFTRWYSQLVVPVGGQQKWGMTERGWVGGTDSGRASEIRQETAWIKSLTSTTSYARPQFYIFWNTTGTENNPALLNGPQATQAVKEAIVAL